MWVGTLVSSFQCVQHLERYLETAEQIFFLSLFLFFNPWLPYFFTYQKFLFYQLLFFFLVRNRAQAEQDGSAWGRPRQAGPEALLVGQRAKI